MFSTARSFCWPLRGTKDQTKLTEMKTTLEKYKKEQEDISKEASGLQEESAKALKSHLTLSYAETFLQVAIGISAISALTRRKWLWIASLVVASRRSRVSNPRRVAADEPR